MDSMTTARRAYKAIILVILVRPAMNSTTPNEFMHELTPGDEVLFYKEKKRWDGPYTFLHHDHRLPVVLDDKGREHLFHSIMLKPYHLPLMAIKDMLIPADNGDSEALYVLLVEMVHDKNDPRFTESRKREFYGILNKGDVKPFFISVLPPDTNIIGNRFVVLYQGPWY